jgi:acylphosphatase
MDANEARMYVVHGRVQGVGFRYFVERAAADLGLAGYVRNRADLAVEVYALGRAEQLDQLETCLRSGPRLARVERLEQRRVPAEPRKGFRIEY